MSEEPLIVAGSFPPDLIPFCQLCDMPCERIGAQPFKEHHQDFMVIEAQCCGQNSASRISIKAVFGMKARGEKWYAIVRRGLAPGVRERKRNNFAGLHQPRRKKVA